MYYQINEETARHAWDNVHMSEYKPGSATAEYRAAVDAAAKIAADHKTRVSVFFHEKIDSVLDSYSRRLADWINDHNANMAKYPSVFICGAGNYNIRKHNAQMAREDTLWKQYEEIRAIPDKIRSIGTGAVDLTDPTAAQQLQAQLEGAEKLQQYMKDVNAHFRKHHNLDPFPGLEIDQRYALDIHGVPFPAYELTSIREKIKRIRSRMDDLSKLQQAQENPAEDIEFEGGYICQNAEENRLQIIFDSIPDPEIRAELKSSGFRWSPKNSAWQRQLTDNALRAARRICCI